MRVPKRLGAALAVAGVLTLAACGSSKSSGGGSSGGGKSNNEPLKVALITPSGGPLAVFGKDENTAWQFAADEVNAKGGVDGHKVQIITAQTDGTPSATVSAARKATTQQGAHFLGSIITSPEHGALAPQLAGMNALDFNSTGKDDVLTGKQCSANAFRSTQSTGMDVKAIAQSLGKIPGQKWAIQAVDYSTGHTAATEITSALKAAGKQVGLTQFAPLNTTDFGSAITKLKSSGADAVFAVEYGGDGVAFVNQGAQFKLFDKMKTVVGFNMVSEPLFPVLGSKIVGFYNNIGYVHGLDNSLNKAFAAAWQQKYGKPPYYVQADTYLAAQLLFNAVKKAHSVDPQKVRDALNGLSFDSIVGPVTMRAADHQVLRPSYVGQVVKEGSGLGWKLVSSTPASVTSPSPDPSCKL